MSSRAIQQAAEYEAAIARLHRVARETPYSATELLHLACSAAEQGMPIHALSQALSLQGEPEGTTHWIRWRGRALFGVRFGRSQWRFSERYQGTRGIPVRYLHLFGGRLTLIRGSHR